MKYIIKTGFLNITHDIQFDKTKENNGKNLSVNGHVLELTEIKEEAVEHVIKAKVVRTTSVSEKPYIVILNLDANRKITITYCECRSRESKKCKHLYAVIYTVNNFESLSKTTYSQEWGKVSAATLGKEKYSKGRFFNQMYEPPPDANSEPYELKIDDLEEPSALKFMMMETVKPKMIHEINYVLSYLLERVFIKAAQLDCEAVVHHILNLNKEHLIFENKIVLSEELEEFYTKEIVLSEKQIIKLSCDTLSQSQSQDWFIARNLRISASKKVHSIKSRVKKPIATLVSEMIHPKAVNSRETKYGLKYEKQALTEYMKLYSCEVIEVGVIVSDQQPWLCASLDSVVVENCCLKKIVEIKCPYTCREQAVVDFNKKTCAVNFLYFNKDEVELKQSDLYYTQCQTQMYVSGLTECDLFVFSLVENGSYCITILRDDLFLKKTITECHSFYFKHLLPSLYEDMKQKNSRNKENRSFSGLDISNRYLQSN